MDNIQMRYTQIEILLNEIRDMIFNEIGINPYEDLDKMIKVVSQKNYNHFASIRDKLKNLSMMIYNRNLDCSHLVFEKIDRLNFLMSENPI